MQEQHDTVRQEIVAVKKPYHTPTLTVYGDISTLTQNTGFAGLTDDGSISFGLPLKT